MQPNSYLKLCFEGTQSNIAFLLRKMYSQIPMKTLQIISEFKDSLSYRKALCGITQGSTFKHLETSLTNRNTTSHVRLHYIWPFLLYFNLFHF